MRKIICIAILVSACISCDTKLENVENVFVEQEIPKIKISLTVNISKRINHNELKILAERIYDKYDGKQYKNVFVTYVLPQMELGNGSYATSHYNPNLDLRIYELTDEEIFYIKRKFSISNRYWIDGKLLIEIEKQNNNYYVKRYGDDLSTRKEKLIREVKDIDTIFKFLDSDNGEYYLINSNNDLSVYDDEGYINSFLRN